MPWSGAGDGAGPTGAGGPGALLAEDVVLPPQADSWMRAAVQQELLREQLQEQAVAQQFHQQQYAAAGVGMPPPAGVDMSQQPLLNAQVCRCGWVCFFQCVVKGIGSSLERTWEVGDSQHPVTNRQNLDHKSCTTHGMSTFWLLSRETETDDYCHPELTGFDLFA